MHPKQTQDSTVIYVSGESDNKPRNTILCHMSALFCMRTCVCLRACIPVYELFLLRLISVLFGFHFYQTFLTVFVISIDIETNTAASRIFHFVSFW